MSRRIISSVVGLPILILIVAAGGFWLRACVAVLSVIGMSELFSAVSGRKNLAHYAAYAFAVLYVALPAPMAERYGVMLFAVFVIVLLICTALFHERINISDVSAAVFGFFYIPFLMYFTVLVRNYEYGIFFVWLIFISAWGSDTFAYFTGTMLGRRKLCPKLSPQKTVEGAAGGVAGATLAGMVYAFAVKAMYPQADPDFVAMCAVICAVAAVFSQLGDLSASAIKRYTRVKDFGHIIPGHGGVLDRFDSLVFTAPGVYLAMVALLGRF